MLSRFTILAFSLLISFVLISSCIDHQEPVMMIEMDYLNIDSIEDGDWIQIDGIKFTHHSFMADADTVRFSLPASRITMGSSEAQQGILEPFPSLSIGLILGILLENINVDDELQVDHDFKYKLINKPLLQAIGKLQFIRTDSSEVIVQTSENYPVEVRFVEYQ